MDLINYLLRGDSLKRNTLLEMGKEASAKYLSDGGDPSTIIAKFAHAHGWNKEEVQRVVEVANNCIFNALFQKTASKVVTFPAATADAVMGKVPKKQGPSKEKTASAQPQRVAKTKLSYVLGSKGKDVGQLLFPDQFEKTAAVDASIDPMRPATRMFTKLASQKQHLEARLAGLESTLKDEASVFLKTAANMIRTDGISLPDIEYALATEVTTNQEFIKSALAMVQAHVEQFDPLFSKCAHLEQRGSGTIANPNHPLVTAAKEMQKLSRLHDGLKDQLDEVSRGHSRLRKFLVGN